MTGIVIAWWFLLWTPVSAHNPTIVGPFDSAAGCDAVRVWATQASHLTSHPVAVSPCWSGPFSAEKIPHP